jgi:hypothetical protein
MMIQGVSIGEMINQSMTVLTKPAVATFEQYERRGGQREGMTYVVTAAAISGIVSLLVSIFTLGNIVGAILVGVFAVVLPIVGYFVSSTVIHAFGTSQGGTGTKDEVFYTLSLFLAPILAINGVISNIPVLACLAAPVTLALGIYQIYLGYLSIRSSMNLDQNKAIITMIVSWIAQVVVLTILGVILGFLLVAVGVVPVTTIPTS